jgi:hypothetical protein
MVQGTVAQKVIALHRSRPALVSLSLDIGVLHPVYLL